jgi:riboflavin biosynthesis pyrimidine reductase
VENWRDRGHEVLVAGQGSSVEARPLTAALGELGYRSLFLLTGPRMLEAALREGVLSRLYLTLVHRILGGESIQTMISGPRLGAAGRLRLGALYHDLEGPEGSSQWFAEFEPAP